MPVYQRNNEVWMVRISHKGAPRTWNVNGSKQDALQFEAQKRLELACGDPESAPRTGLTFFGFCTTEYIAHAKLTLSPNCWRRKQKYVLTTLYQHLGDYRLSDINASAIERYVIARREQYAETQRHKLKGTRLVLKESTLNTETSVLRSILHFAASRGHLVAKNLGKPLKQRSGDGRVKFWTQEEITRLLTACFDRVAQSGMSNGSLPALVLFLANTGCRKGEALALRWEHVDLDRRHIRIWPSDEWRPKNNLPREIPISDALLPWLSRHHDSAWVFPTRSGAPYSYWPQNSFDACRQAAGLKGTGGPHKLRHSFAAAFLAAGGAMWQLSQILGHSHERTTSLYAHLTPEHLEAARNIVNVPSPIGPAAFEAAKKWR